VGHKPDGQDIFRAASAFFAVDEGMRMLRVVNSLLVRIAIFVALVCGLYIYALGFDWAHQNHSGIVALLAVGLAIGLIVLLAQRLPLPIPQEVYDPHDSPFRRRSVGGMVVGAGVCLLGLAYMLTVGWIWQTWVSGALCLVLYGTTTVAVRRRARRVALQNLMISSRT
jgi:multisubunit Na+/H+ antiporter MnhB subunit